MTACDLTPAGRRAHWYAHYRADGFDALSAWNGARARIRMFDAARANEINEFVAECAADGVSCTHEEAASIIEDREYADASVSPDKG